MPRANRYFLPGYIWHITHRCHKQEFLLKFYKDRKRYLYWMFEAKKRYGLCVLNYIVTSNHIHLLVKDTGSATIPMSLQLIAGRTAQEFNNRKNRKGAFWEDRYHATAVESGEHLFRCIVYIDLNMVRASVVHHPSEWAHSGYREIHFPPKRYHIIDTASLINLCGIKNIIEFRKQHLDWITNELKTGITKRDASWSESIAVGSEMFVDKINSSLAIKTRSRRIIERDDKFIIHDNHASYTSLFAAKKGTIRKKNTI